jgi:misacylated tRNA(Ala) deacylase
VAERLYLSENYCFEADAIVTAINGNALGVNQTCFYPGGGGQPPDEGTLHFINGESLPVISVRSTEDGMIWHITPETLPVNLIGQSVHLKLDKSRRLTLMRYHTALHVLNTIALQDYNGWITGVQIGTEYSRIDFNLENFSATLCTELEKKVNNILQTNHALRSYNIPEDEFLTRKDLLRTLEARPPILNGQVRVVEIEGFDAQACGGTHVHNTLEVGNLSIFRLDNKGRINKRLYVRLAIPIE